jgi:hypothetical protein
VAAGDRGSAVNPLSTSRYCHLTRLGAPSLTPGRQGARRPHPQRGRESRAVASGTELAEAVKVVAMVRRRPEPLYRCHSRGNYSRIWPITRAAGKHHVALARYAQLAPRRCLLPVGLRGDHHSPDAGHYYYQRRAGGDTHHRGPVAPRRPPSSASFTATSATTPLKQTHRISASSELAA